MSNAEKILIVISIIGAISLIFQGIHLLTILMPRFLSARARFWRFLSDVVKIRYFKRAAIGSRIEQTVNQTAFRLKADLPPDWIKRAKIKWIRNNKMAEFGEGKLVLRVRPQKDQDLNLMNALYSYYAGAIFPNTKAVLPQDITCGVSLAITRVALEEEHPFLLEEFDEHFLNNTKITDQQTIDCFADCVRLNDFGFLMGPFIREVDQAASTSRFGERRDQIPLLIKPMLNHMLNFQNVNLNLPESAWFFNGPSTSYGFSLVSRPPHTRPPVDTYVQRAQDLLSKGVKRFYVIGRKEEAAFVKSVIKSINSIRELRLVELFRLNKDYRGQGRGLGALFVVDEVLMKLNPNLRWPSAADSLRSQVPDGTSAIEADVEFTENVDSLQHLVEQLIISQSDYDNQWIFLGEIGNKLRQEIPDFMPQSYGGHNLHSILKRMESLEFDQRGLGPAKSVYVRIRKENISDMTMIEDDPLEPDEQTLVEKLLMIIDTNKKPDTGWIFLGRVGKLLKQSYPNIIYERYGSSSFKAFLEKRPEFEVKKLGEASEAIYVRKRE